MERSLISQILGWSWEGMKTKKKTGLKQLIKSRIKAEIFLDTEHERRRLLDSNLDPNLFKFSRVI